MDREFTDMLSGKHVLNSNVFNQKQMDDEIKRILAQIKTNKESEVNEI